MMFLAPEEEGTRPRYNMDATLSLSEHNSAKFDRRLGSGGQNDWVRLSGLAKRELEENPYLLLSRKKACGQTERSGEVRTDRNVGK